MSWLVKTVSHAARADLFDDAAVAQLAAEEEILKNLPPLHLN
jgi:hypothetical protein